MRVYYEIVCWDNIDDNDTEALKSKAQEFTKRLSPYGILSFNMRGAQQQETQQQQAQPQPQPQEQTEDQYQDYQEQQQDQQQNVEEGVLEE